MGPESFNLRALERLVFRSVDELVDDSFPIRHRDHLERLVTAAFLNEPEFALGNFVFEMINGNVARMTGTFKVEDVSPRGRRIIREARVVAEGLYDFSPRNWSFRLDVVHMRAEIESKLVLEDAVIAEILAHWKRLPAFGRFRYQKGVFLMVLPLQDAMACAAVS